MSYIRDLMEDGKVRDAINIIGRQDRVRKDDLRLGQQLINMVSQEMNPDDYDNKAEYNTDFISRIFYKEDREFIKLIFKNNDGNN